MTDLNKNWAPQMTEAQQVKNSTASNKMKFDNPCKENLENNSERIKHWEKHSLYHLVEEKETERLDEEDNMFNSIRESFTTDVNFRTESIPARKTILNPWFCNNSLGFIFGPRGAGKTWFAWGMAINIAKGVNYGPWQCEKPQKVLYVDGEMPRKAMQDRMNLLNPVPSGNLTILSREKIPIDPHRPLFNLALPAHQRALLRNCILENFKVIFLDNLSSLCWGMKENEADSWEQVLSWLLMFRQAGIAVVIIHHSNRTGNDMRGTSRREDAADWIIQVSPNFRFTNIDRGTAFTTKFTKNRDDGGTKEKLLDWTFTTTGGCIEVNCGETNMEGRIYELIKSGMGSNAEIAEETGITKGAVSQHIKRLTDRGFIRKEGQIYVAIENYTAETPLRK